MTQERLFVGAPIRARVPLWDGVAAGERSVVDLVEDGGVYVQCRFGGRIRRSYAVNAIELDVERLTFPIPAERDPWRESEPGDLDDDDRNRCGAHDGPDPEVDYQCSRRAMHCGHHVARNGEGEVLARWPQAPEKRLPQVGDEVVNDVTRDLISPPIHKGARGRVIDVDFKVAGDVRFVVLFANGQTLQPRPSEYGTAILPAAEWEARQKRDTERAPPPNPSGEWTFITDVNFPALSGDVIGVDLANRSGDWTIVSVAKVPGIPEIDRLMCPAKLKSFARALFELDMDEHAIRVGDDGGGIGKAAVLDRMWARLSDEMRDIYMWRAAIVLKRATELP